MFHRYSKRVHLPLTTNCDCFLDVEENSFHLERGKLYEFNNLKLHRSKNFGETNRVHIIVDIIKLDTLAKCKDLFAEKFYNKVNYLENDF
jgi:aspartyl/asparaginyl beta-hydroxylase (cupin superfamily)